MTSTLFLKPDEGRFLILAVASVLTDLSNASKNEKLNWTPETRKMMKSMISAGVALKIKLEKLGIDVGDMPDYKAGDENEFLTKQS